MIQVKCNGKTAVLAEINYKELILIIRMLCILYVYFYFC